MTITATFTLVGVLIGAAILLATLAVLLALRDVVKRSAPAISTQPAAPSLLGADSRSGRLDRIFERLVEESGTRFEPGAVLLLLFGAAVVAAVVVWGLMAHLLLTAGAVLVAPVFPLAYLSLLRWRRLKNMRKNLPGTLEVVADAIRSGKTLQQTFEMVAAEINSSIGPEFAHAARQLDLGNTPESVLDRMARRLPLPEFRIFATAIVVHRQAGGNLALLTERLAAAARDREQFHGHLSAITIGSRLSAIGVVVGTLIGVGVLTAIEPDYLRAFVTNPYGPLLLAAAGTLQLIGIVWAWRVLRVQY